MELISPDDDTVEAFNQEAVRELDPNTYITLSELMDSNVLDDTVWVRYMLLFYPDGTKEEPAFLFYPDVPEEEPTFWNQLDLHLRALERQTLTLAKYPLGPTKEFTRELEELHRNVYRTPTTQLKELFDV